MHCALKPESVRRSVRLARAARPELVGDSGTPRRIALDRARIAAELMAVESLPRSIVEFLGWLNTVGVARALGGLRPVRDPAVGLGVDVVWRLIRAGDESRLERALRLVAGFGIAHPLIQAQRRQGELEADSYAIDLAHRLGSNVREADQDFRGLPDRLPAESRAGSLLRRVNATHPPHLERADRLARHPLVAAAPPGNPGDTDRLREIQERLGGRSGTVRSSFSRP